jgi:hypothetical protein
MIFSEYTRTLAYFLGNSKIGEKRQKSLKKIGLRFSTYADTQLPDFHDFNKFLDLSSVLRDSPGIEGKSGTAREIGGKIVEDLRRFPYPQKPLKCLHS